ncbi:MAG: hypothetical protein QW650_01095 [Thermofilum sp.]
MKLYDDRLGVYGRVKGFSVQDGRVVLELLGGRKVEVEAALLRRVPPASGGAAVFFWAAVLVGVVYCAVLLLHGGVGGVKGALGLLAYCAVGFFAGWRLRRAVETAMGFVFASGSARLVCESREEVEELIKRVSPLWGVGDQQGKEV